MSINTLKRCNVKFHILFEIPTKIAGVVGKVLITIKPCLELNYGLRRTHVFKNDCINICFRILTAKTLKLVFSNSLIT